MSPCLEQASATGNSSSGATARGCAAATPRRRPSRIGSIGWGTAASARDQLASQASSGRPVSTRIGGQSAISSLSCLAIPMPPVGVASPSRIDQIEPALIHLLDHHRAGGDLDVGQLRQIRVHPLAQRQLHLLAGPRVVAVDEDPQRPDGSTMRRSVRASRACRNTMSPEIVALSRDHPHHVAVDAEVLAVDGGLRRHPHRAVVEHASPWPAARSASWCP